MWRRGIVLNMILFDQKNPYGEPMKIFPFIFLLVSNVFLFAADSMQLFAVEWRPAYLLVSHSNSGARLEVDPIEHYGFFADFWLTPPLNSFLNDEESHGFWDTTNTQDWRLGGCYYPWATQGRGYFTLALSHVTQESDSGNHYGDGTHGSQTLLVPQAGFGYRLNLWSFLVTRLGAAAGPEIKLKHAGDYSYTPSGWIELDCNIGFMF
jgi:hypothetical protein